MQNHKKNMKPLREKAVQGLSSESDTVKISSLAKFSTEHYNMTPLDMSKGLVRLIFYERNQNGRLHKHLIADEYFCILEGKGTITVGGAQREAAKGDIIKVSLGIPHRWTSGTDRLVILSIIMPSSSCQFADNATKAEHV